MTNHHQCIVTAGSWQKARTARFEVFVDQRPIVRPEIQWTQLRVSYRITSAWQCEATEYRTRIT